MSVKKTIEEEITLSRNSFFEFCLRFTIREDLSAKRIYVLSGIFIIDVFNFETIQELEITEIIITD